MKTTIALICLLFTAAAPLAFAQDISAQRKKLESPYKSQAELDQHKVVSQALGNCVAQARANRIDQRTPEWAKFVATCQQQAAQQTQQQDQQRFKR